MTHRERIKKALNHEESDRVPIDIGGVTDTSIHKVAYEKLKKYLEIKIDSEPCFASAFWLQTIIPNEDVMKKLDVDCRGIGIWDAKYNTRTNPDGSSEYVDQWGVTWKKSSSSYHFDPIKFPFNGEPSLADLERYKWPDLLDSVFMQKCGQLKERAKYLHEKTDYAVMLDCTIEPLTFSELMLGFENWCINFMSNRKFIEALMKTYVEVCLKRATYVYDAVGEYIDVAYGIADDLGTQDGLWISASDYRKYIKPLHKKIVEFIRSKTSAKILFHSCGDIYPVLADVIDMGIDAFTPVQVSCKNMDSKRLKKEFGDNLTWWGGIDTQRVLPFGTPEDVGKEVKKRIHDFAPRGGYVLNSVHSIQPGVPPENIVMMVKAAKEYGKYPIKVSS